jgi:transcriptional regulator with XRE-family HTH domain
MESNFGNVFEPSVLRWAREKSEISLESLAIKLQDAWKHITPTLISQWEEGTVAPSPAQVKKLAEIYKRSVAVFLLANPPEENIPLPDRRTVGSKQINKFLPETLLMIRRARKVQLLAEELRGDLGIQRPFKYQKHDISENPVNLAVEIRKDLEIPIRDQFKSKKYSIFFDYLRKKIEGTGVIV